MNDDKMIIIEIGKMMREIFRIVRLRSLDQIEVNLTHEQKALLFVISKQGSDVIQKDIAEEMGKDKSTILRLTDALEEKDLVRKVVDKKDRRKNYLMITKKGENILEQHLKVMNTVMNEIIKDINEQDLQTFLNVVHLIKNKASKL
ncbi:MAG: hypothetical protein A2X12_09820 [Bacteroidetes bacterium GWE2_29_8]|nr:MAG: hypothetical protein A2X12_09820 [Bacteroidetes bacterium GWE2_29_8]